MSISSAIVAASRALSIWMPLLLVRTMPPGSQSSGSSGSIPAPMMWIQRSRGAADASSASGKRGSRIMSFEATSASRHHPAQLEIAQLLAQADAHIAEPGAFLCGGDQLLGKAKDRRLVRAGLEMEVQVPSHPRRLI